MFVNQNTFPLLWSFVKWQRNDLRCSAFSTYVNVDRLANDGMRCFDITHADVLVESWAGGTAGENADLLITFENSITTTAYTSFNHLDANKFAFEALLFYFE